MKIKASRFKIDKTISYNYDINDFTDFKLYDLNKKNFDYNNEDFNNFTTLVYNRNYKKDILNKYYSFRNNLL